MITFNSKAASRDELLAELNKREFSTFVLKHFPTEDLREMIQNDDKEKANKKKEKKPK